MLTPCPPHPPPTEEAVTRGSQAGPARCLSSPMLFWGGGAGPPKEVRGQQSGSEVVRTKDGPPAADRGPTRAGAAGAESPRGRGLLSAAHAEMADPDAPGRPCCWRALSTRLDDGHLRVARSDGQAPGPVPSGSCKPSRRHSWDLASGPPAAPAAPLLGFPPCFPLVHLLHLLSNPSLPS